MIAIGKYSVSLNANAQNIWEQIVANYPEECRIIEQFLQENADFQELLSDFLMMFDRLVQGFTAGQTLFLCGNGGSFSDCLHIAGELMKTFRLKRALSPEAKAKFAECECGDLLAEHLECGLPCIVLGLNPSLSSAIQNDSQISALQYAQELYALGKSGDMLLGISTSGNALNVRYAVSVAKVLGMSTFGLTGSSGGKLAEVVDLVVKVPETVTYKIQEQHIRVYHTLCLLLETRFFDYKDNR